MKRTLTISLLSVAICLSAAAQATMYRWVDDKGKVHYGDTIPAEYAKQGNAQINQSGVVVKKTDAALTPEQIRARDEKEAKEKADKIAEAERQRRDKALLATYTDYKEIDLALQRNLGQVDIQIKSNELRIKSIQGRLDNLRKQEAGFVQRKRPVPPDVISDIKKTEDEINHFRKNMANFEQEKNTLRERFGADKVRFRELKGLPPETTAAPGAPGGASTTPAAIATPTPPTAPVKPVVPAATPTTSPAKK